MKSFMSIYNSTYNPDLSLSTRTVQESNTPSSSADLDEVSQERLAFYEEENAKFEEIFKLCKLNLDNDAEKLVDDICKVQVKMGLNEISPASLTLSYAEDLSTPDYLSHLKAATKLYIDLNKKLSEDISFLTQELEFAKQNISELFNFKNEEVHVLEKKIQTYEQEIAKCEKKCPWLKDPQMDLVHISNEANKLADLQEEKKALEAELSIYQNLEPDLKEASRQLAQVKKQYEDMKKVFYSKKR